MSVWDSFYGNPVLAGLLEEAEAKLKSVDSDDDPTPEEGKNQNVEQIAQSFMNGDLGEEELTRMYQSGALTREDIEQILELADGAAPEGESIPPEELFAQQIEQVNDSFIRFSLFDKINDLKDKLDDFVENFGDVTSPIYDEVQRTQEFLKILSSLVFTLDVSVVYQMYGSIELRLIEMFDEYEKLQHKEIAAEKAKDIIEDDYDKQAFKDVEVKTQEERAEQG